MQATALVAFINVPAAHGNGADKPATGQKEARVQAKQTVMPVALENVPATHRVAFVRPVALLKLPAGAKVHVAEPTEEAKLPIGHSEQVVWPVELAKEPAAHA